MIWNHPSLYSAELNGGLVHQKTDNVDIYVAVPPLLGSGVVLVF